MNKIPCVFQNTEAETLPADACIFGHFGWLSPAAVHSADCRFDSGVKWWIHDSSIVTYLLKTSFCWIETVANNALNRRHIVVDWLWANVTPTWNTIFLLTNVHAKWWMHCLLISSTLLLSHTTSIYDRPKQIWSFLVFSGTTAEFGRSKHSASFLYVEPRLKSAYHLLTVVSNGAKTE